MTMMKANRKKNEQIDIIAPTTRSAARGGSRRSGGRVATKLRQIGVTEREERRDIKETGADQQKSTRCFNVNTLLASLSLPATAWHRQNTANHTHSLLLSFDCFLLSDGFAKEHTSCFILQRRLGRSRTLAPTQKDRLNTNTQQPSSSPPTLQRHHHQQYIQKDQRKSAQVVSLSKDWFVNFFDVRPQQHATPCEFAKEETEGQ